MSLEQHINNSGFPLQIALSNLVKNTNSQHGWNVLYEEHGWKNNEASGFIDLVLEDRFKTWLMNIECKRVQDTSWIFLVPTGASKSRRKTKLWVTNKSVGDIKCFNWFDIPMDPETYQSEYCVVPGQDSKSRPMLEHVAAEVVSSTEALANEEANIIPEEYSNLRIYQNVIVTTAELKVCLIDPKLIDLTDGKVQNATFVNVPFVRFRKQLSHPPSDIKMDRWGDAIHSLKNSKENTVFIVQALEFLRFLQESELPDNIRSYVSIR